MKKTKLLTPILSTTALAGIILPLTSCGVSIQEEVEEDIITCNKPVVDIVGQTAIFTFQYNGSADITKISRATIGGMEHPQVLQVQHISDIDSGNFFDVAIRIVDRLEPTDWTHYNFSITFDINEQESFTVENLLLRYNEFGEHDKSETGGETTKPTAEEPGGSADVAEWESISDLSCGCQCLSSFQEQYDSVYGLNTINVRPGTQLQFVYQLTDYELFPVMDGEGKYPIQVEFIDAQTLQPTNPEWLEIAEDGVVPFDPESGLFTIKVNVKQPTNNGLEPLNLFFGFTYQTVRDNVSCKWATPQAPFAFSYDDGEEGPKCVTVESNGKCTVTGAYNPDDSTTWIEYTIPIQPVFFVDDDTIGIEISTFYQYDYIGLTDPNQPGRIENNQITINYTPGSGEPIKFGLAINDTGVEHQACSIELQFHFLTESGIDCPIVFAMSSFVIMLCSK